MAKNQNQGSNQRKPRDILGSEVISMMNDVFAVIIAQAGLGAARNIIGGFFSNNMATVVSPTAKLDDTGTNAIRTQFVANVDASDLPHDIKQDVKIIGSKRIMETMAALADPDPKITPAERQLRVAKLAQDLSDDLLKAQAKRHTFQTRIFEMLSPEAQVFLVATESVFNDAQRQRWIAVRENIESPAVLVAALQMADNVVSAAANGTADQISAARTTACDKCLSVLEAMTAKPKLALGKTLHDALDQFRAIFEHTESPLPVRAPGETDDDYFNHNKAELAKRNITSKDALLAQEQNELKRVEQLKRRQQADKEAQRNWDNLLGRW